MPASRSSVAAAISAAYAVHANDPPTEMQKDGAILRGVVHDPTARFMGGAAGHAGVFSTADDLAKFCQMILDGGDGLFSPATIAKFPKDKPETLAAFAG